MTLSEVAMYCGVRVRTVREWLRLGKIHGVKSESGYKWIIPQEEADKMLEKRYADKD